MNIGSIQAHRGTKAFGFVSGGLTAGQFEAHIPLHIVSGARPGPTLLVQAGVSGMEIEPAQVLPKLVASLDPATISGTLLVVPLLNTTGFELEQTNALWDGADLGGLGKGRADGTISERLIDRYYQDVVAHADALLDLHTGALWGYFQYAGVYDVGAHKKSCALALELGLPQVLLGQPADQSMTYQTALEGTTVVSLWIGGGPGLRDYREDDNQRITYAVLAAMQHLGMLSREPAAASGAAMLLRAGSILRLHGEPGLIFMDTEKRGRQVQAGEELGLVRHPFTGDLVHSITAPRGGVLLHAGAVWPVPPEGALLAIIGDPESATVFTA